jgi:hypothetical protein
MEGMMSVTPNPADFSVDERPREYQARIRVRGSITMTIYADSEEKARDHVSTIIDDEDWCPELDDVEDVDVDYLRKTGPVYRVMRDGKAMQVSHLLPGDTPRDPTERGF